MHALRVIGTILACLTLTAPALADPCTGPLSLVDANAARARLPRLIYSGEWDAARTQARALRERLPCLGEPIPSSVLASILYQEALANLSVGMDRGTPPEEASPETLYALRLALILSPTLDVSYLGPMGAVAVLDRGHPNAPHSILLPITVDPGYAQVWLDGRPMIAEPLGKLLAGPHLVQVKDRETGGVSGTWWDASLQGPLPPGLQQLEAPPEPQQGGDDAEPAPELDADDSPQAGPSDPPSVDAVRPPGREKPSLTASATFWAIPHAFLGADLTLRAPIAEHFVLSGGAAATVGGFALGSCEACSSTDGRTIVFPTHLELLARVRRERIEVAAGPTWASVLGGGFGTCAVGEEGDCLEGQELALAAHAAGLTLEVQKRVGPVHLNARGFAGRPVTPSSLRGNAFLGLSLGVSKARRP